MTGIGSTLAGSALAALTAMALAAGCGDEDGEPAAGTTARTGEGGRTVIAALGDSITAGSPGFDPDPGARRLRLRRRHAQQL